MRKILYAVFFFGCCASLLSGCIKEEYTVPSEKGNALVQLNIGTRAVEETDGTPTNNETVLHSLRVYAFVNGQPAGHFYTKDGLDVNKPSFLMHLTMYSAVTQEVDFYVVANEAAMETPGGTASLTENTTETQLNHFTFTQLNTSNGLPMFCKQTETIDLTQLSDETPADPEHAGHTLLGQNLTFELKRPIGKLGVFAAKPVGENSRLRVTGLTVLASGTRTRNYLMPQTDETLKAVTGITGDISLEVVEGEVTKTLAENASQTDKENPANYTPVLNAPFYLFENPWGSTQWDVKGDDDGNVLRVDYEFDGNARTGFVYMPPIERNKYYTVCCLMHNDGNIFVEYKVADWNKENYNITFDYPSYNNPIMPADGSTVPEGGQYRQPTIWYNNDATSGEGSYSFTFSISGPDKQKWVPTLLDATAGDFEVTVYQKGMLVDPGNYVASSDPYQITIKALKSTNVDKTVSFAISYTPAWDQTGSSLLLINGQSGSLKWQGSNIPEAIVIKQIEVPINN